MPEIDRLSFNWVAQKLALNQYDSIQKMGDARYEQYATPTKISGAAIKSVLLKKGQTIVFKNGYE